MLFFIIMFQQSDICWKAIKLTFMLNWHPIQSHNTKNKSLGCTSEALRSPLKLGSTRSYVRLIVRTRLMHAGMHAPFCLQLQAASCAKRTPSKRALSNTVQLTAQSGVVGWGLVRYKYHEYNSIWAAGIPICTSSKRSKQLALSHCYILWL